MIWLISREFRGVTGRVRPGLDIDMGCTEGVDTEYELKEPEFDSKEIFWMLEVSNDSWT